MLFRLCLAFGVPHPDMLVKLLSSRQLQDWVEFDRMSPIGAIRDDMRHAMLMALLAAAHGKRNAKPSDFLPRWHVEPKQMTDEQMKAVLKRAAAMTRAAKR